MRDTRETLVNEADAVLCFVVPVVLSRVREFNKHQTWAAVSATRWDHVGGIVETQGSPLSLSLC